MSLLAVAIALAKARQGLEEKLWEVFAYGARYGKQPLSELKAMTLDELARFTNEISNSVRAENNRAED